MALSVTFFLGIFIMVGAVIARQAKNKALVEQLSISIAFGTMTALALTELMPEAVENLGNDNMYVMYFGVAAGILVLKLLDRFIPDHDSVRGFDHQCTDANVIHIGIISSVAIILHNVIEGMAVYSISSESLHLGLLVSIGVGLHNVPMGMVIYSTLSREKRGRKIALLLAAALSTFVGGLLMKMMWSMIDDFITGILISLTLGMIVYIVLFELLVHLMHTKNKLLSAAGVAIGVAIILVSGLFG